MLSFGDGWQEDWDCTVLRRDGSLVMQGKGLQLLHSLSTGQVQGIVAMRNVSGAKPLFGHPEVHRYSALYDTNGNLLEDWAKVYYSGGVGDLIVCNNSNYTGKNMSDGLYSISKRQMLYEGVTYVAELGNNRFAVMDAGSVVGVLDGQGREVCGFPMQQDYTGLTGVGNYYASNIIQGNSYTNVVLNHDFEIVMEIAEVENITEMGGYLVVYNYEQQNSRVLAMPSQNIVYETPPQVTVEYFDGEIIITSAQSNNWEQSMATLAGEELITGCEWIVPTCEQDESNAQTFLAYQNNRVLLLGRNGEVLQEHVGEFGNYSAQYTGGNYVVYQDAKESKGYSEENERNVILFGPNLEVLIPAGKYDDIYLLEDAGSTDVYYSAMQYMPGTTNLLVDVYDGSGTLLLEELKELQQTGPGRFVVIRGFSGGLVNAEGNWLYKTSAFGALEDE